jgi:hypothetical protein
MRTALIIGGPLILILLVATFFLMKQGIVPSFGILKVEQEPIEYRTGDESNYQTKQPGIPKYGNIQMKQVDPPTLSIPAGTAE